MKYTIFLLTFFLAFGANAQTPICKIDTTGWKRVSVIPIKFRDISHKCEYEYSTNSYLSIGFETCPSWSDNAICKNIKDVEIIDLDKYNSIDLYYANFGACGMSMDYSLYKDGKNQPILIVNIYVPEIRCKAQVDMGEFFLVSKKDCPIKPKVCILQHQINNSWEDNP